MASLDAARIAALVAPYVAAQGMEPPAAIYDQLAAYLDLLLRWNARTNLTAVREPERIVERHFGESLFAGCRLEPLLERGSSLLDFGSGAGFPGLPIQLLLPGVRVTLAESQGKKAAFLREAVRVLGLSTEVWARRVESMPSDRRFDSVTLRAVDDMERAREAAWGRVGAGGWMVSLEGTGSDSAEPGVWAIPGSERRVLRLRQKPV
jgi:16S rRNA (guanine527-N7)-methyltransferase